MGARDARQKQEGASRRFAPTTAVHAVLVGLVLLTAAALRFCGLDWDRGTLVHPDERRILMVASALHLPRPWDWSLVLSPRSPLNPRFFAYGSLPIYLVRLAGEFVGLGLDRLLVAGRALSAAYGVLTVAAVYWIGRRLQSPWVGLLAAGFLAVAVLPIQLSHFLAVDTLLVLLTVGAVYSWMRVARYGSWATGVAAGVLTGLALATKTAALPLVAVGWVAWAAWTVTSPDVPQLWRGLGGLAASAGAQVVAFLLAQPYSAIDWFRFGLAVMREGAMVQGRMDAPYTRQFIGTLPYLYPLRELLLWSLGLPLGLLGVAGILWLTWRGLRERRPEHLVLLAWFWPYFLVVGAFHAKFPRYMAPLIPWLCVAAALLLARLWEGGNGRERALRGLRCEKRGPCCVWRVACRVIGNVHCGGVVRGLAMAVTAVTLVASLLYAVAFAGIYLRPHPWIEASEWIRREVPAGAVLAVEVWDDPLPVQQSGMEAAPVRHLSLDLYAPDDARKLDRLAEALSKADYVVLSSQRLYATIARLPTRYPLTSAYYRLLFAERLGFRLVDVRTNYPRLGPVAIVDEPLAGTGLARPVLLQGLRAAPVVVDLGRVDESMSVYDHPRTLVFRKETRLTRDELVALLLAAAE